MGAIGHSGTGTWKLAAAFKAADIPATCSCPGSDLNRIDARPVAAFAEDVRRIESLGWAAALQPHSQRRRRNTCVPNSYHHRDLVASGEAVA